MSDPFQQEQSFLSDPSTSSALARVTAPSVAPIGLFAPPTPPKKRKKPVKPAGVSTWVVGAPVIVFLIVVAPANPAFGVLVVGAIALLTGLYTLVLGRPSWARIRTRRGAATPMVLAAVLIGLSAFLPHSLIVAPRLLTALPVPTAEQTQTLASGFEGIDTRFSTDWDQARLLAKADDVCRNDFASQTPEQEVASIQEHLTFSAGDPLTADQARGVLNVVRSAYCGEPGSRSQIVQSELSYSVPALWSMLVELTHPNPAAPVAP